MAVTLKFQSSGTVPGNARPIRMQGGSLTVGRGPANDLVLPDPDRILSKNHFVSLKVGFHKSNTTYAVVAR